MQRTPTFQFLVNESLFLRLETYINIYKKIYNDLFKIDRADKVRCVQKVERMNSIYDIDSKETSKRPF
jgi:hypothetical protein